TDRMGIKRFMIRRPDSPPPAMALILASMTAILAIGCDRDPPSDSAGNSSANHPTTAPAAAAPVAPSTANMVLIPAGTFRMGTDSGMPHEAPAHEVTVHSFWIDKYLVTVAQFAAFVKATGYKTDAEKFGWS